MYKGCIEVGQAAYDKIFGTEEEPGLLTQLKDAWQRYGKIFISFYQIVSTFLKSLSVPWPKSFSSSMARVSVINLNLVHLPKAACVRFLTHPLSRTPLTRLHPQMTPNPSYFEQFNGFTLGLLAFIFTIRALRLFGLHVLPRFSLRGRSEEQVAARMLKFETGLLVKMLLVLYLAYPGVSVAIFGIFSCTTVSSGLSYLDADVRIMCYTSTHNGYLAAGVLWVLIFTFGIPAYFLWLLLKYKVPILAKELADNAWLREVVKLSMLEGLPLPPGEHAKKLASLSTENIEDGLLEALYAFFLRGLSPEAAANIMTGVSAPLTMREADVIPKSISAKISARLAATSKRLNADSDHEGDEETSAPPSPSNAASSEVKPKVDESALNTFKPSKSRSTMLHHLAYLNQFTIETSVEPEVEMAGKGRGVPPSTLKKFLSRMMHHIQKKLSDISGEKTVKKGGERRAAVLAVILRFARTSGAIAIPAMKWEEEEEEEGHREEKPSNSLRSPARVGEKVTAKTRQLVKCTESARQTALKKKALKEVGFLFAAYTPTCYYWEIVELGRKLALTSILSLITPGTAGQVVVGLLLAFFMLLVNIFFQPYADSRVNNVNIASQLNLTLFLLVALLLKVNLDDQGQAGFFAHIISLLSVFPVALPMLATLYGMVTGSHEDAEGALEDSGAADLGQDSAAGSPIARMRNLFV